MDDAVASGGVVVFVVADDDDFFASFELEEELLDSELLFALSREPSLSLLDLLLLLFSVFSLFDDDLDSLSFSLGAFSFLTWLEVSANFSPSSTLRVASRWSHFS